MKRSLFFQCVDAFKSINRTTRRWVRTSAVVAGCAAALLHSNQMALWAAPAMIDPNLVVSTVVSGLNQPTTMAFLGPNDLFVLEKASGKVLRVVNGAIQSTVLDLVVNSGSERGLLGIALHPNFPANPGVYLYWTQSSTNSDTDNLALVPLLGNR